MSEGTITCGGPNVPMPGATRMACTYCDTSLFIPENLRKKATAQAGKTPLKPVERPEVIAPELLRKVQPVARGAWNLYAAWTWFRWLAPTCLVVLLVMFMVCAALGVAPIVFRLFR